MNYKIGLRIFLFFTSGTKIFGVLPMLLIAGLKGREKEIGLYQTEHM